MTDDDSGDDDGGDDDGNNNKGIHSRHRITSRVHLLTADDT